MLEDRIIGDFHFLRPWWLLLLLWTAWLHWRLRRRYRAAVQWQDAIAPHLLEHLTVVGRDSDRVRPYQILTAVAILGTFAAAGPAWERQITPFTEDTAPLVVALELTPSMLATDVAPTRLERAKHKLRDIMHHRQGARTAVIVYAGTAHVVLPLTDDVELIETYLESLVPSVMPAAGDNPAAVLRAADALLATEAAAGTILFITDGIDASLAPLFGARESADQILILGFGTDAGGVAAPDADPTSGVGDELQGGIDLRGLQAVAAAAGTRVVVASVDDRDIDAIMGRVRSHLVDAISDDDKLAWRDMGYVLTWPVALLLMLFWRRGWTVQWV